VKSERATQSISVNGAAGHCEPEPSTRTRRCRAPLAR
jgi:hypothetical protein